MKILFILITVFFLLFNYSCKNEEKLKRVSKNAAIIAKDSTINIDTIITFNKDKYHIKLKQIPNNRLLVKKIVEQDTFYFADNTARIVVFKNDVEYFNKEITINIFKTFLTEIQKNEFILCRTGLDSVSSKGVHINLMFGLPEKEKYFIVQDVINDLGQETLWAISNNIYGKESKEFRHHVDLVKKVISSSLPLYKFYLYTSTDTSFVYYDSLLITNEADKKIQTIYFNNVYEDEEELWTSKIFFTGLNFIDLNFDGYLDLDLFISAGASGNYNSLYWLFDPGKNIFIYNKILSNLVSVHADSSKKLIHSYLKPGDFYEYVTETYRYINGNLILIRKESYLRAQGKKYHEEKIYERIRGKLKLISNKRTNIEGYDYDWFIKNNL